MITSMTGFGRAESQENGWEILVEIRSLNHRFLDVEIRVPKTIQNFEQEIKELIRARLSRGRVNATINIKGNDTSAVALTIDKPLVTTYVKLLEELRAELGLKDSINLDQLLSFPDIITAASPDEVEPDAWEPIKNTLVAALDDLMSMRAREGAEIQKDLESRLTSINERIELIDRRTAEKSREDYDRLKNRVLELAGTELVDENRLEMELALLAEKSDVTEECIRFRSHNTMFFELLSNGRSEGRKLNFLLQEMHREANTIGAKASDAQISHWVVDIKEEVEKLREQIQNIE